MTWQLETVPCDHCGSVDADILIRGRDRAHGLPGEFNVVRCRQCGLARTSPRPTLESLAAAYPEEYPEHQGPALRTGPPAGQGGPGGLLRWALVNLRGYPPGTEKGPGPLTSFPPIRWAGSAVRWLLQPLAAAALARRKAFGYLAYEGEGRLLDFGCGTGGYVAKMAAAGWKAEGLDASPQAVRLGREAGLVLHEGTLPGAALPAESFDAVTMWQALEHVPSPRATLEAVRRLLRPGGRLLVVCPRLDSLEARWFGPSWFGLELPRHLTHFTPQTLRRHVEAAALEVEGIRSFRRPALIRRSFAQLADSGRRPVHRRLASSRLVPGLLSWLSLLAGRTGQMMCLARKR